MNFYSVSVGFFYSILAAVSVFFTVFPSDGAAGQNWFRVLSLHRPVFSFQPSWSEASSGGVEESGGGGGKVM